MDNNKIKNKCFSEACAWCEVKGQFFKRQKTVYIFSEITEKVTSIGLGESSQSPTRILKNMTERRDFY